MPSATKIETPARRIAALEKRIAKLEKAAVKFEEHRQAAIWLNKQLKIMKREMEADEKSRKQSAPAHSSVANPAE